MANVLLTVAATTAKAALTAIAARTISSAFARDVEGPRLDGLRVQSSTEGAPLPIVYGRMRLAGQIVWAARFRETATTGDIPGGKGAGPTLTEYAYSVSFALALCEGPIGGIGRIWADGEPMRLADVTYRVHLGSEQQLVDPLIEAIESDVAAPAMRGTAYIVFEDLALEPYGNRIPQINVEVFRAVAPDDGAPRLQSDLRGVTLIPGSGEFAYATVPVRQRLGPGADRFENMNNARGLVDIRAALDDLEAQLPGVTSVMLVVSWFGTDLRAGASEIRPGVETRDKLTRPLEWRVNGVARTDAYEVSRINDRPAYGGTPSDTTVVQAITELKARGYKVGLYPFILMDVPSGSGLPDPYGAAEQAAYPWRGRITCHPAAGQPGSPDKSAVAGAQVDALFGQCAVSDFSTVNDEVAYSGPAEWSLRRMILHYAHLAQVAGGVDRFLIGSEMRGLTTVRDGAGSYPAVDQLRALAGDVRGVVGPDTKLSYAADWSEYFGHQPDDGAGDVYFHLDPLWADAAIDFVGIDWYAPLSDWRDGQGHADAAQSTSGRDVSYLQSNVEAGEGYDWYYDTPADRDGQVRTPITDGAAQKPWVFRYKDLRNWWSNQHYDRPGGVEAATATDWVPESKPIVFVEMGCPAVDKGANQPNVFIDPKSAESQLPYYSSGERDDLIQRRYLEALIGHWAAENNNPVSSIYNEPMIDMDAAHAWTWDARPYPDFPARADVWADGGNWRLGHWLTGRAGAAELPDILAEIAHSAAGLDLDSDGCDTLVAGYVIDRPMPARRAMEQLTRIYDHDLALRSPGLAFIDRQDGPVAVLDPDKFVLLEGNRRFERRSDDAAFIAQSARLDFYDDAASYQPASAYAQPTGSTGQPPLRLSVPLVLDHNAAEALADRVLKRDQARVETIAAQLAPSDLALEPGDVVSAPALGPGLFQIASIVDGPARDVVLERTILAAPQAPGLDPGVIDAPVAAPAAPFGVVLDIPLAPDEVDRAGPRVAAFAAPWPNQVSVSAGAGAQHLTQRGALTRPAMVGELNADLPSGPMGRWDFASVLDATFYGQAPLASADPFAVLNGANTVAIAGADGEWELVQFAVAELVGPNQYRLSQLLRGQSGSELGMGALAGASVIVFNGSAISVAAGSHERDAQLLWSFAPLGREAFADERFEVDQTYFARHLRPLSPVHVRAVRQPDGIHISWIRRTRLGGDDWSAAEVPLGEESEQYQVDLLENNVDVWSSETSLSSVVISNAEEAANLSGAPVSTVTMRIAQISPRYGAGAPAVQMIQL